MPEEAFEEDLRSQIWVDLLYGVIDFAKNLELTPIKAKAFLNVMTALHGACIETLCSKEQAFSTFTDTLLRATKGLPLAERFSLEEVRRLTEHVTSSYLASLKLHQLVFTEEQTVAAHQAQMAAEFAAQEQLLLDRVAALESKLS